MPALSRRRAALLISAVKQSARSLGTAPLWYWGRRGTMQAARTANDPI